MSNPNRRFAPARFRIPAILLGLFLISVLVRRPLFNQEFTYSWEWLSAHTLMTCQLWSEVPVSIHHFNLLYTFPNAGDKWIDNLWQSGVVDRFGNSYYVSMPHLAFLTPFVFLRLFEGYPTLPGLQIFALILHFSAGWLLFVLARGMTRGKAGSTLASIAAFTVLLFAPTALFSYQNAVVGTVLVIPYTLLVLITAGSLLGACETPVPRRAAWLLLGLALLLGCLTDWQAYFTAFSLLCVSLYLSLRHKITRATGFKIAALCCIAVCAAILVLVLQDSRIRGPQAFFSTIFGRLRVRAGFDDKQGLGLTTLAYYRNLARFYSAYVPFLIFGIATLWAAYRSDKPATLIAVRKNAAIFSIAFLAVLFDHIVLAHHTAQQSFTTLNSLVPIGILAAAGCAACLETSPNRRRASILVTVGLGCCIVTSVAEYEWAYRHRPHPFLASAQAINQIVKPSDVVFAIGDGFEATNDFPIPQLLIYVRRNIEVVKNAGDCAAYLTAHSFSRGVLVHLTSDYHVSGIDIVDSGGAITPAR